MTRGILLFWSIWAAVVAAMNTGDAMKAAGLLSEDSPFASSNLAAIEKATAVYNVPKRFNMLLLLGATCWEALSALLFLRAFSRAHDTHSRSLRARRQAFKSLLGLFAAFIVTDEVLHDYRDERDHRGIASFLLTTLLATELLPEDRRQPPRK